MVAMATKRIFVLFFALLCIIQLAFATPHWGNGRDDDDNDDNNGYGGGGRPCAYTKHFYTAFGGQ